MIIKLYHIDTKYLIAGLTGLEPVDYFVKGNCYNHRSNYESDYRYRRK